MRNTHTSAQDWKGAADVVGEVSLADSFAEVDEIAPPRLRALFRSELVVWERFANDLSHRSFRLDPLPATSIASLHAAFEAHFHEHPGFAHFGEGLGAGMVFLLSDFGSMRRFVQTGLWREAYVHLRAKHQLGFSGRVDEGTILSCSLNRLGCDYGPRDRELARFVRPQLIRIARAMCRREAGLRIAGVIGDLLRRHDVPFAWMTPDGRVLEISARARALLPHGAPNPAGEAAAEPAAGVELRAELRRGAVDRGRGTPRFGVVRVRHGVSALVLHPATRGEAALVLFQGLPTAESGAAPRLTRRETEIVAWLGEGKADAEIAALLGISPRTVGKHCENIFAKLGVSNRLAAAWRARG